MWVCTLFSIFLCMFEYLKCNQASAEHQTRECRFVFPCICAWTPHLCTLALLRPTHWHWHRLASPVPCLQQQSSHLTLLNTNDCPSAPAAIKDSQLGRGEGKNSASCLSTAADNINIQLHVSIIASADNSLLHVIWRRLICIIMASHLLLKEFAYQLCILLQLNCC